MTILKLGFIALILCISHLRAEDEIVLGQSAAFKGNSAILGTELWKGANAYFSYTNAQGGIQGKKIKVLSVDDSYEGKKTLENTIDFIQNKKVFALFGYVGTPTIVEALPAIQKFSKEGVFLFSNFTGAQPQREKPHNGYVFNIRTSYRQETAGLVEHIYNLGKKRFSLFIQFDAYGRAGANGVQRALKDKSLDIVAETTYQRGAKYEDSMKSQVEAIIKANSDVVISVGSYAACAAFIRDARNAGYKGIIANLSFVGPDALLALLLAEESKTHKEYTDNLVNSQVVPPVSDTSFPLVKEYLEIMKKYGVSYSGEKGVVGVTDNVSSFTSLEGFLNAKVFVAILKSIKGKITKEAFYKSAKQIRNLQVGLVKDVISFNNESSQGLNVVYYTTIDNDHYVTIKDWSKFH